MKINPKPGELYIVTKESPGLVYTGILGIDSNAKIYSRHLVGDGILFIKRTFFTTKQSYAYKILIKKTFYYFWNNSMNGEIFLQILKKVSC